MRFAATAGSLLGMSIVAGCGCAPGGPLSHLDPMRIHPRIQKTPSGLVRTDFYYHSESEPYIMEQMVSFTSFFNTQGSSVDPLERIHIGDSVQDVTDVMGQPYILKDGFMTYVVGVLSVTIHYDESTEQVTSAKSYVSERKRFEPIELSTREH